MSPILVPGSALGNQPLREDVLNSLYGANLKLFRGDRPDSAYLLGRIERTLSRFAGSQQTAFDKGATRSAASTSSSQMESQVERAITQVLGRAPGSSSDSFVQALASAFPTGSDGQVATVPQRSAVQIFTAAAATPDGYSGLLSTRQATLARQTQLIISDAARVLAAIQPFDPRAEMERVEALRALCGSLVSTIRAEATRVDEPRAARMDATFSGLRTAVVNLGHAAYLDDPKLIATADDESRAAGFQLFSRYVSMLEAAWNDYKTLESSLKSYSLSEILERVNVELPGLARCAASFGDALNSVGFVIDSDGRSRSDLFTTLVTTVPPVVPFPPGPDLPLPAMTPFDLSDWLEAYAGQEAPGYLAGSGVYGLAFVGDQSDSLFWTIAPVLLLLSATDLSLSGDPSLFRLLTDERVRWSLDDLLVRLGTVADLVAKTEKP
jgi:hypothetical protein